MIVYFSDVHVQLLSISYYNCIHAWLASEINYYLKDISLKNYKFSFEDLAWLSVTQL